mmetsp:Transcript_8858/g.32914  ORF Transcript_8858/g.32914 Transcript_8858/m.32914 type:complete len:270 (-) Transcript_8858:12-821(-)
MLMVCMPPLRPMAASSSFNPLLYSTFSIVAERIQGALESKSESLKSTLRIGAGLVCTRPINMSPKKFTPSNPHSIASRPARLFGGNPFNMPTSSRYKYTPHQPLCSLGRTNAKVSVLPSLVSRMMASFDTPAPCSPNVRIACALTLLASTSPPPAKRDFNSSGNTSPASSNPHRASHSTNGASSSQGIITYLNARIGAPRSSASVRAASAAAFSAAMRTRSSGVSISTPRARSHASLSPAAMGSSESDIVLAFSRVRGAECDVGVGVCG